MSTSDEHIRRKYSAELLLQILHDYELMEGNDLPPAQAILIFDTEDEADAWKLDTSIVVIYAHSDE